MDRSGKKRGTTQSHTSTFFISFSLLHLQQVTVQSSFSFEFGVRAFLHKLSFLHHDNLVGIADGLQMVGNDQDRAVSDKGRHCLLYFVFIDGVNIARYLVQKEDGSILEEGTGDGEALLLSARQSQAVLSDYRFITIGQTYDEVVYHRPSRGFLDFRLRGIAVAYFDVIGNGIGKENDVLHYHADFAEQIIVVHFPYVHSADTDTARLWFPKAEQ